MRLSDSVRVLALTAAWLGTAPLCSAQAATPADVSARVLPSVVQLAVQRPGGVTASGTAFLAVKDGVLVAALHVLKDATRVTATFPNGEEFDCVGIVDRDDRHNLALVRVREFGRPTLAVSPAGLAPGEKVFVPVVKDGAFGVVESSVTDAVVQGGVKFYRLSGPIPDGNHGSPVIDAAGKVVGVHVTIVQQGQKVEMALPSAYILGLEASAPVQPWSGAAPQTAAGAPAAPASTAAGPAPAAALPADDDVDKGLASAMTLVHDMAASYTHFSEVIYNMTRYNNTQNLDLYSVQSRIDSAVSQLGWMKPGDPLRQKLVQAAGEFLSRERRALDLDIRCWTLNKDVGPGKRIPEAENAAREATAMFQAIPTQMAPLQADFRRLAAASPAFLGALSSEMRYYLGVEQRKSRLVMGVYLAARRPMQLLDFAGRRPLAAELGLQPGDLIVSAAGRQFEPADDIEDFKLMIESNAGRTLDVTVERRGKPKTLKMKIPADVVSKYSRDPGGAPQH